MHSDAMSCHGVPKFWTYGSVYFACAQRSGLPRVSLRLARLPHTASSAQRSRRLCSTRAAARVLLALTEVTKKHICFSMGPQLRYPVVRCYEMRFCVFAAGSASLCVCSLTSRAISAVPPSQTTCLRSHAVLSKARESAIITSFIRCAQACLLVNCVQA
jgi:hypothetical protein